MGPEIAQVEGRLLEKDSTGYLLAVSSTQLLRGGNQVWNGEQVHLKLQYLGPAYERRTSVARSVLAGVVGIGGFGLFLAGRSLLGLGEPKDSTPGMDTNTTRLGRP